ncbi:hypothetical protein [Flavobacterium sp.]|uniref:hypothetical protein n=1 Tax=Flavobacterium sp. TaxID=239 RepID=UPI00260710BC|nr:hypothetical protein [Flavobacterium sp.]MDG2431695.1 hypothetical protein [Flavobacterium sp.]
MKTLKLIAAGIILLGTTTSNAQLSVNINVGTPVQRIAPVVVTDYYYLPDIQTYYDVRHNQYIYQERGNWRRTAYLPVKYRNYNVRSGYRVAINDYHGNQPYRNFNQDRTRYYKGYKGHHSQVVSKKVKYKKAKERRYASNDRYQYENRR